jgi:hypothetical protein
VRLRKELVALMEDIDDDMQWVKKVRRNAAKGTFHAGRGSPPLI